MAYPQLRSANASLHAGMTDGAYKKSAPNRGGVVEDTTMEYRQRMSGVWHGFHEIESKVLPDGRVVTVPYYHDVTPYDEENV